MNCYQYAVFLYREDGSPLGQARVVMDFEPVLEWVRFLAVRLGRTAAVLSADGGDVAPIWDPRNGEPFIAGLHVAVVGNDGREVGCDVPREYFRGASRSLALRLVQRGVMKETDRFFFAAAALPPAETSTPAPAVAAPARCTVRRLEQALPLNDLSLDGFLERTQAGHVIDPVDMPVFIPQDVFEETAALAHGAAPRETGGVLAGRLHRDVSRPEIFAEVTAQIPARHTQSDLTRLTFTADTWTETRREVEARGQGELMLGWWHSHAYLQENCKKCGGQTRVTCQGRAEFFSPEDCALHRAVFHRAFCLGLVVSDSPCEGLTHALFGWRLGMIAHRGFHVLKAPAVNGITAGDIGGNGHGAK